MRQTTSFVAFGIGTLALLIGSAANAQCVTEDELSEAAAALMLARTRTPEAIAAALRDAGSDLPHARLLVLPPGETPRARLAGLRDDAPLVCGRATGPGEDWLLVSARGGSLLPTDGGYRVALADGFSGARVAMRDARGVLRRVAVNDGALVRPPEELTPPVELQLVATGPNGPRPVALRSVGGRLPSAIAQGEGDLRARLRALRLAHEVRGLRDNRLLREAAQAHAARVCRAGRARHVLEATRDPQARLLERGIRARVVGEVVARARTEEAAFEALASSPDHRLALVDRRFTDVGIGRHERGGSVCVVVTLAAWPRFVGR